MELKLSLTNLKLKKKQQNKQTNKQKIKQPPLLTKNQPSRIN